MYNQYIIHFHVTDASVSGSDKRVTFDV